MQRLFLLSALWIGCSLVATASEEDPPAQTPTVDRAIERAVEVLLARQERSTAMAALVLLADQRPRTPRWED